jgi:hypothetical protein
MFALWLTSLGFFLELAASAPIVEDEDSSVE